ncbi:MAG: hypothetical protein ACXWP1_05130 [Bdellovibrionota bacterium]
MKTFFVLASLFATAAAYGMPCDVSAITTTCRSASGKYQLAVLSCGSDDSTKSATLKIAGKELNASLEQDWKGSSFVGYRLTVSDGVNDRHWISFEYSRQTMKGAVEEASQISDPGPIKPLGHETIICVDKDENSGR